MMNRSLVLLAMLSSSVLAGCGEHPCTLRVGEPGWCSTTPDDATYASPLCAEVCGVCEYDRSTRMAAACAARCREVVGIPELTCEQLDADVDARYRQCIETGDYPGCGGHSGLP